MSFSIVNRDSTVHSVKKETRPAVRHTNPPPAEPRQNPEPRTQDQPEDAPPPRRTRNGRADEVEMEKRGRGH